MINDERRCYICGRTGALQIHHTLHGCRRKKADEFGLTVYLCPDCHRRLHDHGEHDRDLQKIGQRYFESKYGHDLFMEEFGKNYL